MVLYKIFIFIHVMEATTTNMNKTLIGKNNYLFLTNDTCRELEVHCQNVNLVQDPALRRYSFDKFLLVVFPNKSVVYQDHLPEEYKVQYRPAVELYKSVLKEKMLDSYEVLHKEKNTYYKTDTHINLYGNYLVYQQFVEKANSLYGLHLHAKSATLQQKECILTTLPYGIGDLLWKTNLGDQTIQDATDQYYFSEDIPGMYCVHRINAAANPNLRFLHATHLTDCTSQLEPSIITWDIISNYIIYQKNNGDPSTQKTLIFYDSFLMNIMSLYLELFPGEVYMAKSVYDNSLIQKIQPDFVFEFRVERFLF